MVYHEVEHFQHFGEVVLILTHVYTSAERTGASECHGLANIILVKEVFCFVCQRSKATAQKTMHQRLSFRS